MAETKKCPYCGEEILATAKKCKHCKEWLDSDVVTPNQVDDMQRHTLALKGKYLYIAAILVALAIIGFAVFLMKPSDSPQTKNDPEFENLLELPADTIVAEAEPEVDAEIEEVRQLLANAEYTQYKNARFAFSVDYPNCFIMGEEPHNGDGCGFSMKYGISFSVWGSYNDRDFYGEDIKECYQKDDDREKATYHVQKDNWFVLSGNLEGDKIFYKKVVLMQDYTDRGAYVTFYLLFPKKFNEVLGDFISFEAKNFNPVYEGSYSMDKQEDNLIDPLENLQIEIQRQPKQEVVKEGYTRDQQIALFLLMLAAAAESNDNGGGTQEMSYPCRSCGLTFSNPADLRSHENAVHDY